MLVFLNPLKTFWISLSIFILTGAMCLTALELGISISQLSKFNDSLIGFGIVLAGSGVGIIIAGFAIMAGSLDTRTFSALSKFPYEKTNIPMLNFVFATFVYVFLVFLRLFVVCFGYLLLLSEYSPAALILKHTQYLFAFEFVATLILVPVIAFTLLSIRSFIKNLHGSLLLLGYIRGQMERHKDRQ